MGGVVPLRPPVAKTAHQLDCCGGWRNSGEAAAFTLIALAHVVCGRVRCRGWGRLGQLAIAARWLAAFDHETCGGWRSAFKSMQLLAIDRSQTGTRCRLRESVAKKPRACLPG